MIEFLNPIYLWSLIGVSIPLLIHFLGKKSRRIIPFSYVKLLKLSQIKIIRIEKIQQVLILLLRTILVFCLLIILSEPVSKSAIFKKGRKYAVFLIDNSASMFVKNGTNWEKIRNIIGKIVSNLDKNTLIAFVFLNGEFFDFQDKNESKKIIENMKISYLKGNIEWALGKTFEILKDKEEEKFLFITSDLQKNLWSDVKDSFILKNCHIFVFDLMNENIENLGIKEVNKTGEDEYSLKLVNFGKTHKEGKIKFYYDMEKIKEENFQINPEEEKNIEIKIEKDFEKLKVELSEDDLLLDNHYFFIGGKETKNILIVSDEIYSTRYIVNCLLSLQTLKKIDFKIVKMEEMEDLFLPDYEIIILNDPGTIKKKTVDKIFLYLKNGGNLIYFLGDRINPEIFNSIWNLKEKNIFLLPGKIKQKIVKEMDITYIESKDITFEDFGEKIYEYLTPVKFWKLWEIKEVDGIVLIKSEKNPVMIRKEIEKGTIILFPFILREEWTNFQNKFFFPVFMDKVITKGIKNLSKYSFLTGENVKIEIPGIFEKVEILNPREEIIKKFFKNDGIEFIPDEPGFWKMKIYKGNGLSSNEISVNIDWREGNFEKMKYEEIKKIFPLNLKIIKGENFENFEAGYLKSKNLFDFFLFLSFIFLFLNFVLSNLGRYKGES